MAVVNPAFPDTVACLSGDGPGPLTLQVFDKGGEQFRAQDAAWPTWSADGKVLAYEIRGADEVGIVRLHGDGE